MFYKLSNTSNLLDIEKEFGISFEYPNLYKPKAIVNGLNESSLPIITSEKSQSISFAIWGLLPENYDDDWDTFQDFTNTLNTNIDDINLNEEIYSESLDKRRCLIIVNGFFSSKLVSGKLQLHHVHLKNHKPFCIAGVYNKTKDGFLTCSLLVCNKDLGFSIMPNFGKKNPLVLKIGDYQSWLNTKLTINDLKYIIDSNDSYDFVSHPVKNQFYNDPKLFKRIVNSNNYLSIMRIAGN